MKCAAAKIAQLARQHWRNAILPNFWAKPLGRLLAAARASSKQPFGRRAAARSRPMSHCATLRA